MIVSDTIAPILANLFLVWWLKVKGNFPRLIGGYSDSLFDFAESFVPGDEDLGAGGVVVAMEFVVLGGEGEVGMIVYREVGEPPGVDVAVESDVFVVFAHSGAA